MFRKSEQTTKLRIFQSDIFAGTANNPTGRIFLSGYVVGGLGAYDDLFRERVIGLYLPPWWVICEDNSSTRDRDS
jgi:hypothetical protein